MTDRIDEIIKKFASQDTGRIREAMGEIASFAGAGVGEMQALGDGIATLFYRDDADNPELAELVRDMEGLLASLGPEMAPWIISRLVEADSESAVSFARALAGIGAPAVDELIKAFGENGGDNYALINLLAAAGRFTDPAVTRALPLAAELSDSDDAQVKSAAYYCFGRIANRIPADETSAEDRNMMFEKLFSGLSHPKALVRRSAARALGKLAVNSYLTDEQREKTRKAFRAILGLDEFDWDRAYIVRNEAEYYLRYLGKSSSGNEKAQEEKMREYNQDFEILAKRELCPNTFHFEVNAPLIARKIQAGQFIIIRPNGHSERIPLSICGWDREKGTISIIIMATGRTSTEAVRKEVGDRFVDVIGPLGQRSHVTKYNGTCVVIGGGYGTGAVIPTARDLKELGNKVIGVVGARTKDLLIMVDELREACDEVYVTTNDGSEGIEGFVTHALEKIMEKEKVAMTLAVGPVPMMMAVTKMTEGKGIESWVSLNAIMVDGTGMCGACRVTVGGKTKFACFHGPDFLGHEVDFDELTKRQRMFLEQEKIALEALDK
ncbi:MAG: sulfide/dihydroorotate dehydrogenase-like FAD/NAD-binding protein [Candidatus Nitrospinota bacterium M3_3B_026]